MIAVVAAARMITAPLAAQNAAQNTSQPAATQQTQQFVVNPRQGPPPPSRK